MDGQETLSQSDGEWQMRIPIWIQLLPYRQIWPLSYWTCCCPWLALLRLKVSSIRQKKIANEGCWSWSFPCNKPDVFHHTFCIWSFLPWNSGRVRRWKIQQLNWLYCQVSIFVLNLCVSAIPIPSDFEIFDKLDTYGDNSLHFQSGSTSRNNPVFGSLNRNDWVELSSRYDNFSSFK